ncbi:MAG TPA: ribokinase [Symbiobacteriaceae bacterium]|nr:ribokinase [Symbiobacteriaceae bacterium]
MGKHVVVVGSLNLDLVVRPRRAPAAGETVFAPALERYPGGKGGNQAVAAARLGVPVAMVGCVGADGFGDELVANLVADGVRISAVAHSETAGTGTALITVDATGQNRIVVISGANAQVTPSLVEQHADLIESAAAILLQLEIPVEACLQAAEIAAAAGVPVILDPAPAPPPGEPLPARLCELAWLVTPNETEASVMTGLPVEGRAGVPEVAAALRAQGFQRVIVKAGGAGAYLCTDAGGIWYDSFQVPVVDTTAAGDAFAGGLAAALALGLPLEQAVVWGSAAGALAVTRPGAQPSMGTLAELKALIDESRRDQ